MNSGPSARGAGSWGQFAVISREKPGLLARIRTVGRWMLMVAFWLCKLAPGDRGGSRRLVKLLFGSAARFCSGGAGGERTLVRPVLERVVDCRPEIDQHAQRLAGRVFGVEHYLPGLADHAQTPDRFLGGELGAAAIDGADTAALEFAEAVLDGVEIVVHEAEKYPPDHEAEASKGHHGRGLEIAGRVLCLELASLLKHTAVQQFAETTAARRRLHDGFKRSQPCGELWLLRPEHRLQHLGDVIEVEVCVFQAGRRAQRKILDEQEICLVAVTGR